MLKRYWGSVFCFAVGAGFVILAVYCHPAPSPCGPALKAANTDFELYGCLAGETRAVVLRLDNHSNKPIPIIGSAGS